MFPGYESVKVDKTRAVLAVVQLCLLHRSVLRGRIGLRCVYREETKLSCACDFQGWPSSSKLYSKYKIMKGATLCIKVPPQLLFS